MKVVMLCGEQANQKALAAKVHAAVGLSAIVTHGGPGPAKRTPKLAAQKLWNGVSTVATGLQFRRAWFGMLDDYQRRYSEFPLEPSFRCTDVNVPSVRDFMARERPDLVVVSGTNLLRQPLIDLMCAHGKIMNLHTGISPYVKGGPNCTNWCLYLNEFDLIGNTVMWLDKGIDSGNIIATARTPLTGAESLSELHLRVMEHAHELYVDAISEFAKGASLPSVSQEEFGQKRLFLTKHWGLRQQLRALRNFFLHYRPGCPELTPRHAIRLVALRG